MAIGFAEGAEDASVRRAGPSRSSRSRALNPPRGGGDIAGSSGTRQRGRPTNQAIGVAGDRVGRRQANPSPGAGGGGLEGLQQRFTDQRGRGQSNIGSLKGNVARGFNESSGEGGG